VVEPDLDLAAAKKPPADPCATPRQLKDALGDASQADVIDLQGISPLDCPEVAMTEVWSGGKLIFSDSPEHPSTKGKLYEDTELVATGSGANRVFLYHTNGNSSGRLKFTVLIKNLGPDQATLTVQKSGTAGPTTSYLYAGKKAFERWLLSAAGAGTAVPAGGVVRLDPTFDSVSTATNYLMTGIWDYSMTQPHSVTVCSLDETDDPVAVCPGLAVLPRDSHQRGTCPFADKTYDMAAGTSIDTAGNIRQFSIAGDTATDTDAQCTDKTDGSPQELNGNYGVLYKIHLSVKSTDGRKLGLLLNPRGGAWGGAVWTSPGVTPGGKFLIPAGTGAVTTNTEAAAESKHNPGATGTAPWLQFMSTGGASLPLRMIAVPY
jgi:hypothetical protein